MILEDDKVRGDVSIGQERWRSGLIGRRGALNIAGGKRKPANQPLAVHPRVELGTSKDARL